MTLYKYYPASRIDVLQNELIRYTQPAFLNDPHEMRLNVSQLIPDDDWGDLFEEQWQDEVGRIIENQVPEQAHDLAWQWIEQQRGTFQNNFQAFLQAFKPRMKDELENGFGGLFRHEIGVLSLSEASDNLLMWAHYADSHRGFVLALNEQHPTFNSRRSDNDEFYHPRQVIYSNDRPSQALGELEGDDFLLSKSLDWAYEREWRVIKPLVDAETENDDGVALFSLPAEAIEGIILGTNISQDDRAALENLIRSDDRYCHAWLKEAQLQSDVYALRIVSLPTRDKIHELQPSIPVSIEGYPNDDDCRQVGEGVSAAVNVFRNHALNLSRLVSVKITDKIEDVAAEIWGEEVRPYPHSTIILGGTEDDEFKVSLCIHSDLLDGFLGKGEAALQSTIHSIHRALIRVHDLTNRWQMFGDDTLKELQRPEGRRQHFEDMVQGVWTDYVVAYLSSSSAKAGFVTETLEDAATQISCTDEQIKNVIGDYRSHSDIDRLLRETLPHINKTLRCLGNLYGVLHGVEMEIKEIDDHNAKKIVSSSFYDSISHIEKALSRLRTYYPEWEDQKAYVPLLDSIEQYALDHKLCFGDNEQGLWVAVIS